MLRIPFDDFTPTSTIDVSPGGSISAALAKATPGCMIAIHAGTYLETPKLNIDGKPDAPIIIKSVDGPGQAIIKAPTVPKNKSVFTGLGRKCVVLDGLGIDAGLICENGIQFGLSGSDPSQLSRYVADIVIRNCISLNAVKDNIKISQGDRVWVIDNVCKVTKSDQNIDFLAVNDGVIARNYCERGGGSPPAVFVKGGSERVLVTRNKIVGAKAVGLALGGFGDLKSWARPGATCQAKTCWAIKNYVQGQVGQAFMFIGAVDCGAWENYFAMGSARKPIIAIGPDNNSIPSVNCTAERNVFSQQSNAWAPLPTGCSYANVPAGGKPYARNTYDNIWPRADSVGPASGPVLYGMPTEGSTVGRLEDLPPGVVALVDEVEEEHWHVDESGGGEGEET